MTARKVKLRRPVYATVEPMIRQATGELVLALVASMPVDKRALREKGLRAGDEVRIEVRKARNPYFWRKAHVLGGWLADHVEGFEGLQQHEAVKRLQEQSGIGCVEEAFEIPGLGTCTRKVAEPLDFERMDETRFGELWDGGPALHHEGGWLGWLRREKWGGLDAAQVAEVEALIERPEVAA